MVGGSGLEAICVVGAVGAVLMDWQPSRHAVGDPVVVHGIAPARRAGATLYRTDTPLLSKSLPNILEQSMVILFQIKILVPLLLIPTL